MIKTLKRPENWISFYRFGLVRFTSRLSPSTLAHFPSVAHCSDLCAYLLVLFSLSSLAVKKPYKMYFFKYFWTSMMPVRMPINICGKGFLLKNFLTHYVDIVLHVNSGLQPHVVVTATEMLAAYVALGWLSNLLGCRVSSDNKKWPD